MCVLVCRHAQSPAKDRTGKVVSMTVGFFNNVGGWKKQFPSPNSTYIVSWVVRTHEVTGKHEMQFLGVPESPAENFLINERNYTAARLSWEQHGRRMVPTYTLKATADQVYEDYSFSQTPSKTSGVCTHVCAHAYYTHTRTNLADLV
jgi:hypothetical protein